MDQPQIAGAGQSVKARQPNFLLISTDQQRADHLGCYGARQLRTPHIDGLASRGTRFDRAYVASPVCMPNRSSIATGRMPSLHGVRHNGLNLSLDSRTFADTLRSAGYRTSLSGKAHFQCVTRNAPNLRGDFSRQALHGLSGRYDQEAGPLWRQFPDRKLELPYYGFEHVDLAVGHGDQVDGHYNRWVADQGADLESLRGPENAYPDNDCRLFQAWRTRVPEELYPTRYIQKMTEDALERYAQEPSTPFFHWASFCDPHHPFTPPGRYWDLYCADDVSLPDSFSAKVPDGWSSRLKQIRNEGRANLKGTAALAANETELRWAIALTYGLIGMVDDAVGAILKTLSRLDQERDTIVIFLSDHGDLMGDHGLIFKGPFHYQSVVRMPLIWCDPARPEPTVNVEPVSAVDVPVSIMDAAGVAPFHGMSGRSFLPAADDIVRDAVLIEDEVQSTLPYTEVRGRVRTLISKRWRLTVYDGIDSGELIDLENDPLETLNLWDDPTVQSVRGELTERLLREMLANSESGKLPVYAA